MLFFLSVMLLQKKQSLTDVFQSNFFPNLLKKNDKFTKPWKVLLN